MILVVNAGSSSVKIALFAPDLREVLKGSVTEIGAAQAQVYGDGADPKKVLDALAATLQETLDDNREDYEAVEFEGWN